MKRPILLSVKFLIMVLALSAALVAATVAVAAAPGEPYQTAYTPSDANSDCLACHSAKGLKATLPSGEVFWLYVDQGAIAASVHEGKLQCIDCHRDITGFPHPARQFRDLRSFRVTQYELCKRCHFANYTKTLDSVHFNKLSQGNWNSPVCTDCHGAHNVARPDQPRSQVSKTCSKCHAEVYDAYLKSIHGSALVQENNPDVPVCTDCHRVHDIQNPLTAEFRVQSVELCSECHANRKTMDKYGISTMVTTTYLQSFHGMSVSLSGKQGEKREIKEPVCTDCHGTHDIQQVSTAASPVIKENLAATCRSCHPGASSSFPTSWIGHYEPSLEKGPAVFAIRWFYKAMIPFVIGGLLVHILLDLWKVITNR